MLVKSITAILFILFFLTVVLFIAIQIKFRLPRHRPARTNAGKWLIRTAYIQPHDQSYIRFYKQILQSLAADGFLLNCKAYKTVYITAGKNNKHRWNQLWMYAIPENVTIEKFSEKEREYIYNKQILDLENWMIIDHETIAQHIPSCFMEGEAINGALAFSVEYIKVIPEEKNHYMQAMKDISSKAMRALITKGKIKCFLCFESTDCMNNWNQIHIIGAKPIRFLFFTPSLDKKIRSIHPNHKGFHDMVSLWESMSEYERMDVMREFLCI
jgi:hypothetical protein